MEDETIIDPEFAVDAVEGTTDDGIDYSGLAEEFLKKRIEDLFVSGLDTQDPDEDARDFLAEQIASFDPEEYKNRRFNKHVLKTDFKNIDLDL